MLCGQFHDQDTIHLQGQTQNCLLYLGPDIKGCYEVKGAAAIRTGGREFEEMRARNNEKHPALPARSLDIVKIKGGFECKPGPTAGVKYSDFFDSGEMLNVKLNVQQEFHLFCFNFPQNAITLKQVIRRYHKAKGRYGGTGTVSCVFLPLLVFHVKLMEFWRAIFLFFILKGSCSASGMTLQNPNSFWK